METIEVLKERPITETPLLLFDVHLVDGSSLRWSTHRVTWQSEEYEPRVARHNFFEIQAASESGIDAIPRITLSLANADSQISQIDSSVGLKGARITGVFLFFDLRSGEAASDAVVVFQGILNPPDDVSEGLLRVSAINRMALQRVLLPPVRIQRRCPWSFPPDAAARQEAAHGGEEGRYSRFFPCGYSPGEQDGVGNLDADGHPFVECSFTRAACVERGMFDHDDAGTLTRRFGGVEFVPATIRVRSHGDRKRTDSAVYSNQARYNDFVPMAYGSAWLEPPVVFARNDGNLTRMEVLLCFGEIHDVVKVLVNDIEVPEGVTGRDMTSTGWWNLFSGGGRSGGFNLNFTTPHGAPLGDPYGSMACLSIVTPNQIHDGRNLPQVKVLLEGLKLERFDPGGASQGFSFSKNPAWILLDLLRRCGWKKEELDVPSFAAAAAYCDERIVAADNQGETISIPRFQCNLALESRRSAADVIRGIRNSARLQLTYASSGRLAVYVENSLLLQQPQKPAASNAAEMLNGGWPAYVYNDGSTPGVSSALLRREDDALAVRFWSRPIADTPNRFSIEFADEYNEYQQDSLEMIDEEDFARTGQEISGRLIADGLPSFDQAARILKFFLDKSIRGNRFIEFETSVKGVGQKVGDIIAVTHVREGLINQPFRIMKIEPAANYRSVRITAQIHDDAWYNDTNGQLALIPPSRRLPGAQPRMPDSLYGDEFDDAGEPRFSIEEFQLAGTDGTMFTELEVGFRAPTAGESLVVGIPVVSLQPQIESEGGSLAGGQVLYYAVSALDADGFEGNPSFLVRARLPEGAPTFLVRLTGLRFTPGAAAFNVYRGETPSQLRRIAVEQPIAPEFVDEGSAAELEGAPDPQFDHANFYWRLEESDAQFASIFGPDSIGSDVLDMPADGYAGRSVRLFRGKGAGQERKITNNSKDTLFITPKWEITPDESSIFVISENTWRFGGRARGSPARFQVPNVRGRVVQITGRSANAQNVESLEGLALVTRWRIGGGGLGVADRDKPPEPVFGANARGDGTLEIGGVGFSLLENTQGVTDGTLRLFYYEELDGPTTLRAVEALDAEATTLHLNSPISLTPGDYLQVEGEILRLAETEEGQPLVVERGALGSLSSDHPADAKVWPLRMRTETFSFQRAFFGTLDAASWAHSVRLPDARVAAAELSMMNSFGSSPAGVVNLSGLAGGGLRTHRGGQFNFQAVGVLAQLDNAAPVVIVQENLSIRDFFAHLQKAPSGGVVEVRLKQDGEPLGTVRVADGSTVSNSVDGSELPVLRSGASLNIDIVSVGSAFPGQDLTVTVRI